MENSEKKKKVLLLEDSGYMFYELEAELKRNNFEVFDAFQISDAKDKFDTSIDYIIVDLNVPPIGLTNEQLDKTDGGIFSGWIWLEEYVFKQYPEYKKKVIIYSGYIDKLSRRYPLETKEIKLLLKGDNYGPSQIVEELKKM